MDDRAASVPSRLGQRSYSDGGRDGGRVKRRLKIVCRWSRISMQQVIKGFLIGRVAQRAGSGACVEPAWPWSLSAARETPVVHRPVCPVYEREPRTKRMTWRKGVSGSKGWGDGVRRQ
ncbi:hypothetical protein LIA77_00337 [Sarocladium implicatum]|nr:hypothetical protein LIA77_00337 [Sarocladium implicatum]